MSYEVLDILNLVPELNAKYYPNREMLIFSLECCRQVSSF